jgi:protein-S-isoprenylcysteine O-methyltransferase Ste14
MLLFIGISLISAFWPFLLLALASLPLLHRAAVKEEATARQRFPDEYDGYVERTGRFFPRLIRRAG